MALRARKPVEVDQDLFMLNHATDGAAPFEPGAIVAAAWRDIQTREYNLRCRADRRERKEKKESTKDINTARSYAFLATHVRKAKTAADVIRAALEDTAKGSASTNVNTARLYRNTEALKRALWHAPSVPEPVKIAEPAAVMLPLEAA
jgi:hypothetical protein